MPFNVPVTAPQQLIIDEGGYAGRDYLCATPATVVFRARPSVTSAVDVLFSIPYNTVTVGAFGDVKEDMVVLITSGTTLAELKRPLFRGRVSKVPTSTTLFIGEASIALTPALYITVLAQRDPAQRLRSNALIDGHLVFQKLAPAIKGLSSSYFKEPTAGSASFAFAPTGQAMEDGATIVSWLWSIPGASYTVGTSTSQNPTVSVPTGHVWATVSVTDSNGVVGSFVFEIYVQDRYSSAMIYLGSEGADISNDWDNGVNASVNYFEGVEDLLDRTRCTIVTFETMRDGDLAMPNVSFVGYLRQNDDETRGDAQYSTLKSRSYTIAGFSACMGEVKLSTLAITNDATPTLWDEMKLPNPARVISHIMNRYATLARLCCVDYGTVDNTWFGGNMDVESPFLLDACNRVAEEINAQLIFAADGQIILRRNLCMVSTAERAAADTIATIPAARVQVLGTSHPHMPNLAQLQAGFRSYRTADGSSLGITATAPAIAFNEGADFDEAGNQLLTANATQAAAISEASSRAANLLAYRDDGDEITVELPGEYRFMQPSQHQWWLLDVIASLLMNEIAFTADDRLLLKSMSHRFDVARATRTVRATFRRETVGGLAMILVEVVPAVVPTAMPVRPPMPAYRGAFNPAGTLNYTSQTPARRQPYSPRAASGGMPYSPAQQEQAAKAMGELGCTVQNPPVNFRNGSDVTTPFTTVLSEDYRVFVKGSAKIAVGGWSQHFNFLLSDGGFSVHAPASQGVYTPGVGWEDSYAVIVGRGERGVWIKLAFAVATVTSVQMTFDRTAGSIDLAMSDGLQLLNTGAVVADAANPAVMSVSSGAGLTKSWTGSVTADEVYLLPRAGAVGGGADPGGSVTLLSMTIRGTGTNPFTALPGTADVFADAFYTWTSEDETAVLATTTGVRINSTAVAVPPAYSPNHEYEVAFTGIGSAVGVRFQDNDYTDNQEAILYVMFCGSNTGS